jgi:outer membrane biosynthesis protein TonB
MGRTAEDEATGRRWDPVKTALVGSALLHAALLLLAWLSLSEPAPSERVIPISLVLLGAKTTAPDADLWAPLPQKSANEVAEVPPALAIPAEETPPPPAAPRKAPERSAPDLAAVPEPKAKPRAPPPVKAEARDRQPAAKLKQQPLPPEDLSVRLERLARLRQPAPPVPASPRLQQGAGSSDRTATIDAGPAQDARYGVKDFIRAQVERRWNPDRRLPKGADWVVAIHVMLSPDGNVERAEIVDDPRHPPDAAYRDFARSARNAVLLSSPLTVPPGEYEIAKDIVLDFHARQAVQ